MIGCVVSRRSDFTSETTLRPRCQAVRNWRGHRATFVFGRTRIARRFRTGGCGERLSEQATCKQGPWPAWRGRARWRVQRWWVVRRQIDGLQARPLSSRLASQARANRQSRLTVLADSPTTLAVSSMLKPV